MHKLAFLNIKLHPLFVRPAFIAPCHILCNSARTKQVFTATSNLNFLGFQLTPSIVGSSLRAAANRGNVEAHRPAEPRTLARSAAAQQATAGPTGSLSRDDGALPTSTADVWRAAHAIRSRRSVPDIWTDGVDTGLYGGAAKMKINLFQR